MTKCWGHSAMDGASCSTCVCVCVCVCEGVCVRLCTHKIMRVHKHREQISDYQWGLDAIRGSLRWAFVVQSLSHVQLFATPWTAAHQASLSITNSRKLLKLMSIELLMSSNRLILCLPLLLLPSIFPSMRVFFNELGLPIRWPEYWSFSFSITGICYCTAQGIEPIVQSNYKWKVKLYKNEKF